MSGLISKDKNGNILVETLLDKTVKMNSAHSASSRYQSISHGKNIVSYRGWTCCSCDATTYSWEIEKCYDCSHVRCSGCDKF